MLLEVELVEIRRPIYPYLAYSLALQVISLCGVNFILLSIFINKIRKQKNKNIFREFVFISGFIIAFFIGKYLEGIESYTTEYVQKGVTITYGRPINLSSIINPFMIFLILLDIIILVVKIIINTRKGSKS